MREGDGGSERGEDGGIEVLGGLVVDCHDDVVCVVRRS